MRKTQRPLFSAVPGPLTLPVAMSSPRTTSRIPAIDWLRLLAVVAIFFGQAPSMFPLRLPLPQNIRFRRAMRQFDDLFYGLIRARRAGQETGTTTAADVLSLMLRAEDDQGERMSEQAVRDEAPAVTGTAG